MKRLGGRIGEESISVAVLGQSQTSLVWTRPMAAPATGVPEFLALTHCAVPMNGSECNGFCVARASTVRYEMASLTTLAR